MCEPITHRTSWRGIALSVRHTPGKFEGVDHIEVETDTREPLPITETGYKSLYLCPEDLAGYASPVSFVLGWLDLAAEDQGWTGQLSLL